MQEKLAMGKPQNPLLIKEHPMFSVAIERYRPQFWKEPGNLTLAR